MFAQRVVCCLDRGALTATPLVSYLCWGSIHAVGPYPVPSLTSGDHHRASDTRAAKRKHANSSLAGSVVKKVRCEGEKPSHMVETSSFYTSGPACDRLHGGTSKNARYQLTRPPRPRSCAIASAPSAHLRRIDFVPRSSSLNFADFGRGLIS